MPAVQLPATVLVTGASGFIAAHIIQSLLEREFTVVGTVRSLSKGDYVQDLFERKYPGMFSYVIVEDIEKDGAFDEAVKGVDAVEHVASPFHFNADHPDQLIRPAVQGTFEILKSVVKNGHSVKRVVVTSSTASIDNPHPHPYVSNESDWNTHSPAQIEEKGDKATPIEIYMASKTLAERVAWQFVQDNKESITWDLVAILPPFVFGPTIHQVASPESLNTSTAMFYSATLAPVLPSEEVLVNPIGSWIDVRDVALAHTEALLREEAGGERFIVSAGGFSWQYFLDAINSLSSPSILSDIDAFPKGFPGAAIEPTTYADGSKAAKILGIRYTEAATTAVDTVNSLLERFPFLEVLARE